MLSASAGAEALCWNAALAVLQPAVNLFVVGRGYGLGVAQEAALKLKETCGLHAEAFSSAAGERSPGATDRASRSARTAAAAGFIDTQVNGGGGVLFNDNPGIESIRAIGRAHLRFGATGFLPTLISDDLHVVENAIANAREMLQLDLAGCVRMASEYPAAFLGLQNELGSIAPGYRASLVQADDQLDVIETWIDGAPAAR